MAINYTQKQMVDGKYERLHPETNAGQVITDAERQFVSEAEKTTYAGKEDPANKDKPDGYAGLDSDGKLSESVLPESARQSGVKIVVGDSEPEELPEGGFWFDTSAAKKEESVTPEGNSETQENEGNVTGV